MSLETDRMWSRVLAARAAQIKAQKAYHDAVETYRAEVQKEVARLAALNIAPGPELMHNIDIACGGTGI